MVAVKSLIATLFASLAVAQEQGISENGSMSISTAPNLPEASSLAASAASSVAASAISSILARSSSAAAASPAATSTSGAVPTNGKLYKFLCKVGLYEADDEV
jgi:hypothetical protein